MSRLLPEGLNDPSMYDVMRSHSNAFEDGECSHCGKPIKGDRRFHSYGRYKQELCWTCETKKKRGELGDPKEDIESDDIMKEYGERDPLPF